MIKILIVGQNSFVGKGLKKWLYKFPKDFKVNVCSSRGGCWKNLDFSGYDVIINVSGIAHIKIKSSMEKLFYSVNTDLTINICKKAKESGVKQYIFLSSMNVYGDCRKGISKIDKVNPNNFYGKSKLKADTYIQKMNTSHFKVVSIRPPLIYGKNCKGNYRKLTKYNKFLYIFPDFNQKKSVIYIDNLCEFIRLIILKRGKGVYCPQNKEYTSTTELVRKIAEVKKHKIYFTKIFNPFIKYLMKYNTFFSKIFSDDYYDNKISKFEEFSYNVVDFNTSIKETEN